ncbi:hypothetical protein quinque_006379 [Culex quinquefasciatus]|uniref:nuclear exosome regulator NRDE2 n=1 Tax=Culex quinquefasciatus TaxID=7176 RepID=UPI0018E2A7BB|nr:nuclear exosome regulator NRDE2 [Culex quinquefasciatus]
MSLFPAYSATTSSSIEAPQPPAPQENLSWLTNQSFIPFPSQPQQDASSDSSGPEDHKPRPSSSRKHKKSKKKHRKRKRSRSSSSSSPEVVVEPVPAVNISEQEFYTDVSALRIYLTVETLHRPACPKYRRGSFRVLGGGAVAKPVPSQRRRSVRYFRRGKKELNGGGGVGGEGLGERGVREREMELEKAARADESSGGWIEYLRFREEHPVHLDSYQNSKGELAIVERGLREHPDDPKLLELYLGGIVKVYPTDEVLELIQKMIAKDNTNFLLWEALIDNKQLSMAQCIVPNVLKLYEKSVRSLFMAKRSDEVMLKLFKKCALFCRQAGLWEMFFGLVELNIGMNISSSFAGAKSLFSSPEHFNQLIEYEELVLKSGLPMNEIWLRVEKLRNAFHFLPFRGPNMCSDPQRMVLHEDIVGFVYPLINKEYAFDLVILILKLMKYPFESVAFESCGSFFQPESYEEDHSEQLLPLFLDVTRNRKHDQIILNLIKELNTPPSFVNTNLAFESYLELLRQVLIASAEYFSDEKNIILLLFYLKLERILVVFDRISGHLTEPRKKATRSRVKNLLKKSKYQNDLNFYIEYGLIEYEMDGLESNCLNIFDTSVRVFCAQDDLLADNDLYSLVLKSVELLLKENRKSQAIYLLTKLALNPKQVSFTCSDAISDPTKLLALQKFNDRVTRALPVDDQVEILLLPQYFTHSFLINTLKAYLYYHALVKSKAETTRKLEGFLFHFNDRANPRQTFIREQLFTIFLTIADFRLDEFTNTCFLAIVDRVLHEFPANLTAIRLCAFSESLTWFQLRTILGKHLTTKSVLLLVTTARIRNLYSTQEDEQSAGTYKRRTLNLLAHTLRRDSPLRQNALLWRLYLRELFDQPAGNALEQCRKTLYLALEACPFNKAVYLDGAFFAPQELSQLLDLLLEKQLRIHAIPEELEILRDETAVGEAGGTGSLS